MIDTTPTMQKTMRRYIKFIYLLTRGVNFAVALKFSNWKLDDCAKKAKFFTLLNGILKYKPNGKQIAGKTLNIFYPRLAWLIDYVETHDFKTVHSEQCFSSNYDGVELVFKLPLHGNLFAFREIFDEHDYKIALYTETIAIDVGLNVGLTSLFFAANPLIKEVYGYELVKSTYQQAVENISLNPELANKIKAFNVAWGTSYSEIDTSCFEQGDVRASSQTNKKINNELPGSNALVQIHPSEAILTQIIKENVNGYDILLKLDVEGAELEIIQNLEEHNLIRHIDVLAIEYHNQTNFEIVSILLKNGFIVKEVANKSISYLGMIYAVKKNRPK